jgi:hypothetical protein
MLIRDNVTEARMVIDKNNGHPGDFAPYEYVGRRREGRGKKEG